MKFDMTGELNEIILKYELDSYFPEFQKYLLAIELNNKLVSQFSKCDKVLLCASVQTDIDYFLYRLNSKIKFEQMIVDYKLNNTPDKLILEREKYSAVIVVSYYGMSELMHELVISGVNAISLYEYYFENNLQIFHTYYDYFQLIYFDWKDDGVTNDVSQLRSEYLLYCEKKRYNESKTNRLKEYYISRIIFINLYTRDFVFAKKYMEEYISLEFKNSKNVKGAMIAIENLFNRIKVELSKRTQKDVIMFWFDCVQYGEDKKLKYLSSLTDNIVSFENAYSAAPFTQASFKTMFTGKKTVDEAAFDETNIDEKNSPVIKTIEDHGLRFISCHHLPYIDIKYRSNTPLYTPTEATVYYWVALEEIINSETPVFVLTQECFNTHNPFVSPYNEDNANVWRTTNLTRFFVDHSDLFETRVKNGFRYADEQFEFYEKLLPACIQRIYMSDHGYSGLDKYHTFFKVQSKKIKKSYAIRDFFSYIDLWKVILEIVKDGDMDFSSVARDYVQVQTVDYYSSFWVKWLLKEPDLGDIADFLLGHKGVVTHDEFYYRRNDGYETFINRNYGLPAITNDRLVELRRMANADHLKIRTDGKFKYAKYTYRTLDNYRRRMEGIETKTQQLIKTLFESYTDKVIALRGGGEATFRILQVLHQYNLNGKIRYIFDKNEKCKAALFGGVEVILPEFIANYHFDIIVIPSYKYRDIFLQELSDRKEIVIDLYKYFEENGLVFQNDFFIRKYIFADTDFRID